MEAFERIIEQGILLKHCMIDDTGFRCMDFACRLCQGGFHSALTSLNDIVAFLNCFSTAAEWEVVFANRTKVSP